MAILWAQTGDTKLATAVLVGAAAALAVLALLAWALVLMLSPLKRQAGVVCARYDVISSIRLSGTPCRLETRTPQGGVSRCHC